METVIRDPGTLLQHPKNYRKHPKRQIAKLMESLTVHGQPKPIVITDDGVILAGHGLCEAAKQLGWREMHCSIYRGTNADAFLVMDNQSSTQAEDDLSMLTSLLQELEVDGGLDGTGFDGDALNALLDDLGASGSPKGGKGDEFSAADAMDDPAAADLLERCQPGDEWLLGRHRLVVGAPTDAGDVQTLMGAQSARAIWYTPPYPEWGALPPDGRVQRHRDDLALMPVSGDCTLVCLHGTREFVSALTALFDCQWTLQRTLWYHHEEARAAWLSWTLHGELVLLCTQGGGSWRDAQATTDTLTGLPVEVAGQLLPRVSGPGDIVYAPYADDGVALLACERTGRTLYGLCTPSGCTRAIARYEAETGESAVRLGDEGE